MARTLTWLHLSDLHARLSKDWDSRFVIDSLTRDLRVMQKSDGLRPDLIFFTGDVAFGTAPGETMTDQYQKAREFFQGVREAFTPAVPLRNLYVVPGNHDVDRTEVTDGETEWLRSEKRDLPEILSIMAEGKKQWRAWMDRLTKYRAFLISYGLLHLKPESPHLVWGDALEISGLRVGIVGLNSAWSCVGNDKGKLWCGGDWQIAEALRQAGPVDFAFALIHHPGNWLTDREDPSLFRRLRAEFSIVLHGHEHVHWPEQTADGHLVLSAGACYDCSWVDNAYSFGRIDLDQRNGSIWLRKWDKIGRGWIPAEIFGKTENGIFNIRELPSLLSKPRGNVSEDELPSTVTAFEDRSREDPHEHYTVRYCKHVMDQHDVLELFGCDIPLDLQKHRLSVAYVSLNLTQDEPRTSREFPLIARETTGTESTEDSSEGSGDATYGIEEILDRVSEHSGRLIVTGPAGAGKSTLLRWCTIHAAKNVLSGPPVLVRASRLGDPRVLDEWRRFVDEAPYAVSDSWQWKIPVLIRLRDCPDGKIPPANEFPRILAKHLPAAPADWMTGILSAGRAIILLDGVDEVHRDKRGRLAEEIRDLITVYPDCTYVITTRPGAVKSGWLDRLEFIEASVEPMGRSDREEFITKWYQSAELELKARPRSGEDLRQTAAKLKTELVNQPELGLLASNPLLCAMICALYRERQEHLPETSSELSEALVQMLLHRRERETPGLDDAHFLLSWRGLQYTQKKGLLAEIAWDMVNRGESSISVQRARELIGDILATTPGRRREETDEVLQALIERSGLLRPALDERIDFLHNVLKEYLAAIRTVELGSWEILAQHSDDPAWQPVILFALSIAPEPFSSDLVRKLVEGLSGNASLTHYRNLSVRERRALIRNKTRSFFLVRCRNSAKRLSAELSNGIDDLTKGLFPPKSMHDALALAQIGPRILQLAETHLCNPAWWHGRDVRMIVRCLRLLRLVGGPRAKAALAAAKPLPQYSSEAMSEWIRACSDLSMIDLPWPFGDPSYIELNGRVDSLAPLPALSSINYVLLWGTRVIDLRPLLKLPNLRTLHVGGRWPKDFSCLAEKESLKAMFIYVSALKTQQFTKFQFLEELAIGWGSPDLEPLTEARALKDLRLDSLRSTEDFLKFSRTRPDVRVHYREKIYIAGEEVKKGP